MPPAPGPVLHGRREPPDLMLCARQTEEREREKESEQHERTQMCFHLAGPRRPNDVTPAKLCSMLAGGA